MAPLRLVIGARVELCSDACSPVPHRTRYMHTCIHFSLPEPELGRHEMKDFERQVDVVTSAWRCDVIVCLPYF
jgi:hypothetical protein